MAAKPGLRIGDAEREARAAELREHYAQGRLSLTEFNERLDAVFASRTQEQLDQVSGDLPHVRTPSAPLPVTAGGTIPPGGTRSGGTRHGGTRASGTRASRDQSGRSGARAALSVVAGLAALVVALMTAWLLVRAPAMTHFRGIPLPGRLGILLAVVAVLRGLLRRIFGLGRRRR